MLPLPLPLLLLLAGALTTLPLPSRATSSVPDLSMILSESNELYTSQTWYCAEPGAIIVNKFDIRYLRGTNEVAFDIDAASVEEGLDATLFATLQAYGLTPLNISLDLCSVLGSALCPLPTYDFVGSSSVTIPSSFASNFPAIAFEVPDLQAIATVRLVSNNGTQAACLQTSLSNTKTMGQTGAAWAAGGIAIAAFAVAVADALLRTGDEYGKATRAQEYRFLATVQFFQQIFFSSVLSLKYPLAYTSWATNFAWSVFLIFWREAENSINTLRLETGGHNSTVGNSSYASGVAANEVLGGTQVLAASSSGGRQSYDMSKFAPSKDVWDEVAGAVRQAGQAVRRLLRMGKRDIPVVKQTSETLNNGIPVMTARLQIPSQNAFMTAFIFFLLLIAAAIVIFLLAYVVVLFLRRRARTSKTDPNPPSAQYPPFSYFVSTTGLRLLLLSHSALTLWTFYQWTLSDSWVPQLLAAVWLAVASVVLLWLSAIPWMEGPPIWGKRDEVAPETRATWLGKGVLARSWTFGSGAAEGQFRDPAARLYLPYAVGGTIRSLIIAFGQNHPMPQVILLTIIEGLIFLGLLIARPLPSAGSNIASLILALVRTVMMGLLTAFLPNSSYSEIVQTVIAFVLIGIQGLTIFFLLFLLLINLYFVIRRKRELGDVPLNGVANGDAEKGNGK